MRLSLATDHPRQSVVLRRTAAAVGVAVVLVLVLGAVGVDAAEEAVGSFTEHTDLDRDYWLYQPSGYDPTDQEQQPLPLVMYLHGCNQSGHDAAVGTRWNDLAEQAELFVVYPTQPTSANGASCWNWFQPAHQSRGAGEPAMLVEILDAVTADLMVDTDAVFVLGASAGADMTAILGATYPDRFTAIGVLSGCAYLTCSDVDGQAAHRAMGDHARQMPVIIGQGSADMVNNAALGQTALQQWLGTNDRADDGQANNSVARTPARREHVMPDDSPSPGSGDACIGADRLPCAGGPLGLERYPYTVEHYPAADGSPLVEHVIIHGANHAYTGGDPGGSFTDPVGPDITALAWDFFTRVMDAGLR